MVRKNFAAGNVRLSDAIGPKIAVLEEGLYLCVREIMHHYADEIETYAQDNAPWEDRTGEARDGLTTAVQEEGTDIELVLYNESEHGIWLEIAMSGKYQIIMPTLDHYGPEIMAALAAGILV